MTCCCTIPSIIVVVSVEGSPVSPETNIIFDMKECMLALKFCSASPSFRVNRSSSVVSSMFRESKHMSCQSVLAGISLDEKAPIEQPMDWFSRFEGGIMEGGSCI